MEREALLDPVKGFSGAELTGWVIEAARRSIVHCGLWFETLKAPYGMPLDKEANDDCWSLFSSYETIRINK